MPWSVQGWPFKRPPYPVQIEAMTRGADKFHYGYWLEQGLGKTGVDLANFMYDVHCDVVDAHAVITPSYLLSGWEDEAANWGFPYPVATWPGAMSTQDFKRPFVYIMNQEALLYSGGQYLEYLMDKTGLRWSLSTDDAAIKNFNGITSKRIREFGIKAVKTRDLCGTPMSQSVMDIYPRLRYLRQIHGWNPYQFRNRFAIMGGYMGKKVLGVRNEEELHRIMNPVVFRALKRDWWEGMPEKVFLPPRHVEMSKRQLEAYKSMLEDFMVYVDKDDGVFANQVIHMKQKLQQISRGFIMDKENDRVVELVEPNKNPAIKAVVQTLENTPGKLLIFTHYTYSTNILAEALKKHGVVKIEGGLSKDALAQVKREFNENPDIRALVGIDRLTARGHTLLGSEGDDRCSTSLFYENSYDLEQRLQLEDRNHRFGQDADSVSYIDFFCSPEDKACIKALQQKQNIADAVVNAIRSVRKGILARV